MVNSFRKNILPVIILILIINNILFAQSDSTSIVNAKKLQFAPSLHGIQIDGNIFFISYEIGGQVDFDFFQSKSKMCIGTRLSAEHYMQGDFGGKIFGSPFTNYNFYLRISNAFDDISINVLGGLSYYKTSEPYYFLNKYMPRIGCEFKYGNIVGFILKGSTSFKKNTGFVGIGISLDYNHFL